MKTIAITGADGFIGRNLVSFLRNKGYEVLALVYPDSPTKDMFLTWPGVHTFEYAYSDPVEPIVSGLPQPEVFYHFAWQGVRPEQRGDFSLQYENIRITRNALQLAAAIGAKKVVIPGSTSEYLYWGKPINEHAAPSPQNAYGSVKVAIRYLASACAEQLGLDLIYAVITGVYSEQRRDDNVIYYTVDRLLRGEKPSLTRLEQKWDYIHIDDLLEALYLIGLKGKPGAFYAVGHGDNRPLADYIEMIRQRIDPALPLGLGEVPYQREILPSSCVDLTRLQSDTGFVPRVDFAEGIDRVIQAMKNEINGNT